MTLCNPGAADDEPPLATHVMYASPEFFATPYSYDAAAGGSPTSYSPPVAVAEPLALQLIGGLQRLQLRFRNGRRNVHLQGAAFPDGAPVDLQLRLGFGGGGGDGGRVGVVRGGGGSGGGGESGGVGSGGGGDGGDGEGGGVKRGEVEEAGVAFLLEAIPQLSPAEAREALAAHGGHVERAVATFLGA